MASEMTLIEYALDSGATARDLLSVGTGAKPSRARLLLGVLGAASRRPDEGIKPTAETIRRTSNALDEFANDYSAVAAASDHVGDADAVAAAHRIGSELWDNEIKSSEAAARLAKYVDELQQRRTRLLLDASRRSSG